MAHIQSCKTRSGHGLLGDMDFSANTDRRKAHPYELDSLHREAIDWIVRLTSGEATVEDAERLKVWRARSADHEQAFRRASTAWRKTGAAGTTVPHGPRMSRRLFLAGAGAGGALAAGWAGVSLGLLPGLDQIMADYSTGTGEQARIELPDGSTVDLDGASALDAKFTNASRGVRLITGAAAFELAPDARSFQAVIGPGEITARNAAFVVTMGAGPTLVECTRGAVDVTCNGSVRLTAGQRTSFDAAGLSAPEAADIATAAPWRRGLLIFENRPLAEVVADINRHRRGRIVLTSSALGQRRVDGVFHLARPDEIVTNLANSLKLRLIELPGGLSLLA